MLIDGDNCPFSDCNGIMIVRQDDCSCHISPPCDYCTGASPTCSECGWSTDDPIEGET